MSRTRFAWAAALFLALGATGEAQIDLSADGVIESGSGGFRFPDGRSQASAASAAPAPVGDTGQQVCYSAAGARVACGGTRQDGETQAGVDWPGPRFVDNGDGTVSDRLTGLVWLQLANCKGVLDFEVALAAVSIIQNGSCSLTDGSSTGDWRLPNVKELLSLLDLGGEATSLAPSHPFTNVQDWYWTSTTYAGDPKNAWVVTPVGGTLSHVNKAVAIFHIWPVRDPMTAASLAPSQLSAASGPELETEGLIESTSGGFRFPDGSLQTSAAAPRAYVSRTGQTVCYDPSGNTSGVVSCTGTGQDGELQAGVAWPSPRFQDNGDGTATDLLTGLIWVKDVSCAGFADFDRALDSVAAVGDGDCDLTDGSAPGDWRPANYFELVSLLDFQQSAPHLPTGHPFDGMGTGERYWTSNTEGRHPEDAWNVDFSIALVAGDSKIGALRAFPVRGGR